MENQIGSKQIGADKRPENSSPAQLEISPGAHSLDLLKESRAIDKQENSLLSTGSGNLPELSISNYCEPDKYDEQKVERMLIGLAAFKVKEKLKQLPDPRDNFNHEKQEKDSGGSPRGTGAIKEETFEWKGHTFKLTTEDDVPRAFTDQYGKEWESSDGKGWRRKGPVNRETFQGRISLDIQKGQLLLESPYGRQDIYKSDGSSTNNFKNSEGLEISHTKYADGSQKVSDGTRLFVSTDGLNWRSDAETRKGEFQIDENARLLFKGADGLIKEEQQSLQTDKIVQRMTNLEKQFGIKLGRPPEVTYPDDEEKNPVGMRLPTLEELDVVKEVLTKYAHVAKKQGSNFEGLKINFVSSMGKGKDIDEHAWHDGGENPSISIGPRDFEKARGWSGLEGTLLHEMAHQLQEIRWKDRHGNETVPRDLERFFAYQKVMPPLTKEEDGTYRITDIEGKKWQYEKVTVDGEEVEKWMPIKNGKVSTNPQDGIDDAQMWNRLPEERRPATDYFFHPQEAHAEAMAMFLYRPKMLYDQNPHLYKSVKKWDQQDINYRYGFMKTPDGKQFAKMIRGADGNVVPNTSENRQAVKDQENGWSSQPRSAELNELKTRQRCSCHL